MKYRKIIIVMMLMLLSMTSYGIKTNSNDKMELKVRDVKYIDTFI